MDDSVLSGTVIRIAHNQTGFGPGSRMVITLGQTGEAGTVAEILQELRDHWSLYSRQGGVTLTGGDCDPLEQLAFAAALLRECRKLGAHTAVKTGATVRWEAFQATGKQTELYLVTLPCRWEGPALDSLRRISTDLKRPVEAEISVGPDTAPEDFSTLADLLCRDAPTLKRVVPVWAGSAADAETGLKPFWEALTAV